MAGKPVTFMNSGVQDETYVDRMQRLDWETMYKRLSMGQFLEELRTEWKEVFDFVLIDSRTGVTDTGGICTVQLPDILVAFVSTNTQSLQGTLDVVRRAKVRRGDLPFDRGALLVLPVLTRLETRTEYNLVQEWTDTIARDFHSLYAEWAHREVKIPDLIKHTRIPYVPYWSFGEKLPVVEKGTTDPEDIGFALETLTALVAHRLQDTNLLVRNRDSYVASVGAVSTKPLPQGIVVPPKEYDIADILGWNLAESLLPVMQREFERAIGVNRFFRITGTPTRMVGISADLENPELVKLLLDPPDPHMRGHSGWNVKPWGTLKRNALGFENDSFDVNHLKFLKNGHLEFWTAVDSLFCWRQNEKEMAQHPRLYPHAVVEHPVSFLRLYRDLAALLRIDCDIVFQMQYLNVKDVILLPYRPESIGFEHPIESIKPLARNRLVFAPRTVSKGFDPDPSALELIKDLYYEFGYTREHIPFFDSTGHCEL